MASNKTKQVVLITGASSGMGKSFAKALLPQENLVIYTIAPNIEEMNDLKELGAIPLKMNITNEADIKSVVAEIESKHNGVDILINNAGIIAYGAMEDTSMEDAHYQFEVNLFGLANLTRHVLPSMRRKKAGKIINISSMAGKVYSPLGCWYHASKHALEGLSDCLRLELSQFNIQVALIEPGVLKTKPKSVVMQPMLERSGQGAYKEMATIWAKKRTQYDHLGGDGSDPQIIVDLVVEAVNAKKMKLRYVDGKYAKLMIFIRKWFGDRIFDKIILSTIK